MSRAADYNALNIQARLAAALLTVESWLRAHRVQDTEIAAVIEHLWQFPTVTPSTFDAWYAFDSEILRAAVSDEPLPPRTALICAGQGVVAQELAMLLADAVNIVYDCLFGALDLQRSLSRLQRVEAVAGRSGISLPSAGHFTDLGAHDMHGWGLPVSVAPGRHLARAVVGPSRIPHISKITCGRALV